MHSTILLAQSPGERNIVTIAGLNPEPWEIGSTYVARKGGKLLGRVSPSTKLQAYQDAIREELADLELPPPVEGPVDIFFWFWRRIDTWTNTDTGRTNRANVADSTNLQKSTEDALQGLLYDNDRLNYRVGSEIVAQHDDTEPAIVIGWKPYVPLAPVNPILALVQGAWSKLTTGSSNQW